LQGDQQQVLTKWVFPILVGKKQLESEFFKLFFGVSHLATFISNFFKCYSYQIAYIHPVNGAGV
jgi:hypothetical protein